MPKTQQKPKNKPKASKPNGNGLPNVRIAPLSNFRQDDENANKGTPKGAELLKQSLSARRFARPTFAAADGTILGGNKTLSAAQEIGMNEAIVIESDGSRPIVHVRTDLANSKTLEARRLALEDNRVSEVSLNWDQRILGAFAEFDKLMLDNLWDEDQIRRLVNNAGRIEFVGGGVAVNNGRLEQSVDDLLNAQQRGEAANGAQAGSALFTQQGEFGKPLESQIKMLQLFFTVQTYPRVIEMCEKLAEHFATDNITDTVYECVHYAYNQLDK